MKLIRGLEHSAKEAEGTGVVESGEEEAPGRPNCSLTVLTRGHKKAGQGLLTRAYNNRRRVTGFEIRVGLG